MSVPVVSVCAYILRIYVCTVHVCDFSICVWCSYSMYLGVALNLLYSVVAKSGRKLPSALIMEVSIYFTLLCTCTCYPALVRTL